jgi:hypothetical protein
VAYNKSVFLNVPFDRSYSRLSEAAIFAIYDCGFIARCATEDEDSSTPRVQKIYKLIEESKYGIHDISRVTLDRQNRLPRFNMPLELGIWSGAKYYGPQRDDPFLVIRRIRNWLRNSPDYKNVAFPGPEKMAMRYQQFRAQLPAHCKRNGLDRTTLEFNDYSLLVVGWLEINPF